MKTRVQIVCLAALAMAPGTVSRDVFDYDSHVGIVETTGQAEACLTIENPRLKEGEAIRVVRLKEPQAHFMAHVLRRIAHSCSADPDTNSSSAFYFIQLEEPSRPMAPSIGIAGFAGRFELRNGLARADLDANGVEDSFRSCTSAEGVHLTVWDGEPLKGPRRWHYYYYLGYDVEPSCTEKDYSE